MSHHLGKKNTHHSHRLGKKHTNGVYRIGKKIVNTAVHYAVPALLSTLL
jgi:hypothetical protein